MKLQVCLALCFVLAAGCGSAKPKPVPVSGTVRWKGQPMSVGRIQFVPDDPSSGRPATGDIGATGKYRLSTFESNDGAFPGSYGVQVFPFDYNAEVGAKTYKDIPLRYQDPKTSGLTAVVENKSSRQIFDFELTE